MSKITTISSKSLDTGKNVHQKNLESLPTDQNYFFISQNIFAYYLMPNVDALAGDLYDNVRKLQKSSMLVYILGLAIRGEADMLEEVYLKFLQYLPPPLVYGALWYSNLPAARKLIKDHVKGKMKVVSRDHLRYARIYNTNPAPIPPTTTSFNALANPIPDTKEKKVAQHRDELWAQWYTSGKAEWVCILGEMMDDEASLRKMVDYCDEKEKNTAQVNIMNEMVFKEAAQRLFFGSMVYDTNLVEAVRKEILKEDVVVVVEEVADATA